MWVANIRNELNHHDPDLRQTTFEHCGTNRDVFLEVFARSIQWIDEVHDKQDLKRQLEEANETEANLKAENGNLLAALAGQDPLVHDSAPSNGGRGGGLAPLILEEAHSRSTNDSYGAQNDERANKRRRNNR
mmetsp:Transcript_14632/g.29704  ORF Transcript_14632/g.29704 Transcript_14632/m.29704 type:complete len:132 (+) Transcript_14632:1315-1710(+)